MQKQKKMQSITFELVEKETKDCDWRAWFWKDYFMDDYYIIEAINPRQLKATRLVYKLILPPT